MKVYCRYAVIDKATGYELACGEKYKDFQNSEIRYIEFAVWRDFPFFWRKVYEYFRTLTIKGRECVIVYWVVRDKKRVSNYSYWFKGRYFLRSRSYFERGLSCLCDYLIEDFGV